MDLHPGEGETPFALPPLAEGNAEVVLAGGCHHPNQHEVASQQLLLGWAQLLLQQGSKTHAGKTARLVEREHALQVARSAHIGFRQIASGSWFQGCQIGRLLLQCLQQLVLTRGDLQHPHRQGGLSLLQLSGDLEQIAPHQAILGIGVEVGIGLAVGWSSGDRLLAIEIEVDGHQPGVGCCQPSQPLPALTDRLAAKHIEPDGAHADPIEPFHRIGQQLIGNQRPITVQVSFTDADDPHGCACPGGGRPQLHRQVVGEQIEPFAEAALAHHQQQAKGGRVGHELTQDRSEAAARTRQRSGH